MIRRKGHLTRRHHALVVALLAAPALVAALRTYLPESAVLHSTSLSSLPIATQRALGHALFIPLGALVVVMCRLTLGLRLMSPFRSILLAIAFQVAGVGLGLGFLAVVLAATVAMRPALHRVRLPYYARVSFTLSAVAAVMVATLVVASAAGETFALRVASFPIIALCLTADGFASTLRRNGAAHALWRVSVTAAVGVGIACLTKTPGLTPFLLAYPELLFAQLGLLLVVSEYLDLRLFASWNIEPQRSVSVVDIDDSKPEASPGRASRAAKRSRGKRRSSATLHADVSQPSVEKSATPCLYSPDLGVSDRTRVAVVRNRDSAGVVARLGQPCPEVYGKRTVQAVLDALRQAGFEACAFEGDMSLLGQLKDFLGPPTLEERPRGIVFNMAYGIQGECRYTHVPAVLEMAGIPYTGATPLGHAVSLDKVVTKILMQNQGVPTPRYAVFSAIGGSDAGLRYPLVVKPRHESTSFGLRLVHDARELREAVEFVRSTYLQDALVEEFIDGREVCIGLLGNDPVEILPIVELDFGDRERPTMTLEDKFHKRTDEPAKLCPASLDDQFAERLRGLAVETFRACFCRDYARVDIRIDRAGEPFVLEINSMASLGAGGSYVTAAAAAGYAYPTLIERIVEAAHLRSLGTAPRTERERLPTDREEDGSHVAAPQEVNPSERRFA